MNSGRPPDHQANEDHQVPEYQQAEQLQSFADEIFELSRESWVAQSRSKVKMQLELTETEFLALDVLAKAGRPCTVGQIQREIGVLPAQMSRVIRSLENKGPKPLVECTINAEDKRKIDVELTPTGRETHHAYRDIKLGSIQKMLATLSAHDRSEFMRILRLIREGYRKALA